jgi:PIN domain nuclease of toxin-antitoxin system
MIEQSRGGVWVSAATLWEIAIKGPLKPRRDPMPFSARDAIGHFRDAGFDLLPVRPEHAASTEDLPPLHADPFDRLLVAQARFESMALLTADDAVVQYGHGIVRI